MHFVNKNMFTLIQSLLSSSLSICFNYVCVIRVFRSESDDANADVPTTLESGQAPVPIVPRKKYAVRGNPSLRCLLGRLGCRCPSTARHRVLDEGEPESSGRPTRPRPHQPKALQDPTYNLDEFSHTLEAEFSLGNPAQNASPTRTTDTGRHQS